MKISVADFSAPIRASVFKFCTKLDSDELYCVNENEDSKAHFAFFSNFSFCHSYVTHMDIFGQCFLSNY